MVCNINRIDGSTTAIDNLEGNGARCPVTSSGLHAQRGTRTAYTEGIKSSRRNASRGTSSREIARSFGHTERLRAIAKAGNRPSIRIKLAKRWVDPQARTSKRFINPTNGIVKIYYIGNSIALNG